MVAIDGELIGYVYIPEETDPAWTLKWWHVALGMGVMAIGVGYWVFKRKAGISQK